MLAGSNILTYLVLEARGSTKTIATNVFIDFHFQIQQFNKDDPYRARSNTETDKRLHSQHLPSRAQGQARKFDLFRTNNSTSPVSRK